MLNLLCFLRGGWIFLKMIKVFIVSEVFLYSYKSCLIFKWLLHWQAEVVFNSHYHFILNCGMSPVIRACEYKQQKAFPLCKPRFSLGGTLRICQFLVFERMYTTTHWKYNTNCFHLLSWNCVLVLFLFSFQTSCNRTFFLSFWSICSFKTI